MIPVHLRSTMLQVQLAGIHTLLLSPLCRRCPQGRAGCCAAPPAIAWADIGRIVLLGGRDFLLEEMRAARLSPVTRGLIIRREPPADGFPTRCTYLGRGDRGCTLSPDKRSATCNYYLCDDAFDAADAAHDRQVSAARRAHERITMLYGHWDLALSEAIAHRFPDGPSWDAAFFDWLAAEMRLLLRRARKPLASLSP